MHGRKSRPKYRRKDEQYDEQTLSGTGRCVFHLKFLKMLLCLDNTSKIVLIIKLTKMRNDLKQPAAT